MIAVGTFKARASGAVVLGTSKNKGTPFIEFYLTCVDGEFRGQSARFQGYFTEATSERTIESLQFCGWKGENLDEFADGGLHGLGDNDVNIVVEHEDYVKKNEDGSEENKKSARVAWINRIGGFLNTAQAMDRDAAQSFGDRMRGLVLALKEKNGSPTQKSDDSFPHGANEAPPPAAPAGKRKF